MTAQIIGYWLLAVFSYGMVTIAVGCMIEDNHSWETEAPKLKRLWNAWLTGRIT